MINIRQSLRIWTAWAVVLLSLLFHSLASFAQTSVGVPPLIGEHPQPAFGFEVGVGQNSQSGTMECDCGTTFTGGSGTGWSSSAFYELPIGNDFNVGIKAGFNRENTSTITPSTEVVVARLSGSSQDTTLPIQGSRTGSVTLTILQFEPFAQYQILNSNFFLQVGAGISVLLRNDFTQTRQLSSNSPYSFTNGTKSEAIQGGNIGGITSPQFSGLLSAGYNFRFGTISIAPMVNYDYPFSTNSSAGGNNWKISTVSGLIAMKFNL
jgi:hypothetical protein